MIFLNFASGAQIQIVVGSTVSTIYIQGSYGDLTIATGAEAFSTFNIARATSGTVALFTPSTGHTYKLKSLFIRNSSGSSCAITVQHYDGTNTCDLKGVTLLTTQELHYVEGVGFYLFQNTSGLYVKRTIYTSPGSNTFTPQIGSNTLQVQVVGGGGGGGASGTGNAGNNNAGGGGGSGAYTTRRYVVAGGATYTAVVGGGGNGGVIPSNNGSVGTLSSFTDGSTLINGAGGLGGVFGPAIGAAPQVGPGGAGGAANANGDINGGGDDGSPGLRLAAAVAISGGGGASIFGGGAVGALNTNGTGAAAGNYGSGGAGGGSNNASGGAGGAGSAGIVVVDEYT